MKIYTLKNVPLFASMHFAKAALLIIGLQLPILKAQSKVPPMAHDEAPSQANMTTAYSPNAGPHIIQFRTLEAERVTVMEQGGFWPSAALLKNGELVVVARQGAPHAITRGGSRLVMVRSQDMGKTWSDPYWVAASGPDEDLRDGFITELRDGTLLLAFHIYRFTAPTEYDPVHVSVFVSRSSDRGYTWETPLKVDTAPYPFGSPHGRIIELSSGTLLMQSTVAYTQKPGWGNLFVPQGQGEFQSIVLRSRDGGKTWGDHSLISKGDETSLLLLSSGKLLAAVRGGPVPGGHRAVSVHESFDEGRTWQNLGVVTEPGELPGNLQSLNDGRVLLSFGDRRRPFFGVQAILSHDEGRTWDRENRIQLAWDAPNTDCGYPTSIQLPDGRIFTVYYQVDDLADSPASAKAKAVIWELSN